MKTPSSAFSLIAAILALALFSSAHGETIISDTFTGTDGTTLPNHTPDVNLPGGTYGEYSGDPGNNDVLSGGMALNDYNNTAYLSIGSHGTYTEPTGEVTLSADLEINTLVADTPPAFDRGIFLGFSVNGNPGNPVFSFNLGGILVGTDGTLYVYKDGDYASGLQILGAAPAGFSTSDFYNLSYNLNLTTGELSDVVFDGKTYTVPAGTGDILGAGNTVADVVFGGSSAAAGTHGYVDNLTLTTPSAEVPEPSSVELLIAGGLVTACVLRRRTAGQR